MCEYLTDLMCHIELGRIGIDPKRSDAFELFDAVEGFG